MDTPIDKIKGRLHCIIIHCTCPLVHVYSCYKCTAVSAPVISQRSSPSWLVLVVRPAMTQRRSPWFGLHPPTNVSTPLPLISRACPSKEWAWPRRGRTGPTGISDVRWFVAWLRTPSTTAASWAHSKDLLRLEWHTQWRPSSPSLQVSSMCSYGE